MTEAALFEAYRNTVRPVESTNRPCACGGYLTAPANDQERIRLAVEQHQRTARHRAWWTWQESRS